MLSGYRSLLFVLIISISSFGQIFVEEFEYPLENSFVNSRWKLTGSSPIIESGDLIYSSYPSLPNNKKLKMDNNVVKGSIVTRLPSTLSENGHSVYCSFLFNLFSLLELTTTLSSEDDFFGFGNESYPYLRKLLTIRRVSGGFKIGLSNKDSMEPVFNNNVLIPNTTYLIVVAFVFENNTEVGKLWINPDLNEVEPETPLVVNGGEIDSISKIHLIQNKLTGNMYIDVLRVATTWNESALPVELQSFNAEAVDNCVVLKWRTATEVNNYGFEVERSFDKSNWKCIGFVNGNGNCNRVSNYQFIDEKLNGSSVLYYRLKQIDTDGTYTYSEVTEVKTLDMNYMLGQNYPNPFNPETTIDYSVAEKGFVNIKVYDVNGKEVSELVNKSSDPGEYSVKFIGSALPSGVYMYRIRVNGFVQSRKMLLLK